VVAADGEDAGDAGAAEAAGGGGETKAELFLN
jgi:hypothetical protein